MQDQSNINANTTTADLPQLPRVDDHYDTTTLAQEHLERLEAVFAGIAKILEQQPIGVRDRHALALAKHGQGHAYMAAEDFESQARILDEIERRHHQAGRKVNQAYDELRTERKGVSHA